MANPSQAPTNRPKQIIIERQPDESVESWEQTLSRLASGSARVTRQPDGSALIQWPGVAS